MEDQKTQPNRLAPSLDADARERQLINHAVALAEKQLLDGTASQGVIVHYLKLATNREKMEREILEKQQLLITAKTESLSAASNTAQLYEDAIEAMRSYSPSSDE